MKLRQYCIPRSQLSREPTKICCYLPQGLYVSKGCFLLENEIDTSNCQTHMPNHYLKVEILKLSSITVKCCISVSVLNFIHQDVKSPNNVYLFQATDYICSVFCAQF